MSAKVNFRLLGVLLLQHCSQQETDIHYVFATCAKEGAMGKINWGRVIVGGLVTGAVINVSEMILHGAVFAEEWKALVASWGRTLDTSVTASVLILVLNAVEGIVAVWLYAAIRPRYGPGPKTALLAGLTVWLVGWLIPTLSAIPLNLFPLWVLLVVPGAGLVEFTVGTLLGAWLYKEA